MCTNDIVLSKSLFFFFFQAEDGIRDRDVTGVQTCALPVSSRFIIHCGDIVTGKVQDWPESQYEKVAEILADRDRKSVV